MFLSNKFWIHAKIAVFATRRTVQDSRLHGSSNNDLWHKETPHSLFTHCSRSPKDFLSLIERQLWVGLDRCFNWVSIIFNIKGHPWDHVLVANPQLNSPIGPCQGESTGRLHFWSHMALANEIDCAKHSTMTGNAILIDCAIQPCDLGAQLESRLNELVTGDWGKSSWRSRYATEKHLGNGTE